MEWYNIIIAIVGGIGGVSGIVTLYNARSNKDTIDISNFQKLLDEERKEREILKQDFKHYKEGVDERITQFKVRFDKLEHKYDMLKGAVNLGYKCPWIAKIEQCPILNEIEKDECNQCKEEQ
jgi:hypothetical protein